MMAIHQHQALGVINMLFMNRLRVVKRVETIRLQNEEEQKEMNRLEKAELEAAVGSAGSKPLNKKQQKAKQAVEQKYVSSLASLGNFNSKDLDQNFANYNYTEYAQNILK